VLEANERYRRLVELSPDGILISQNGRIVFANPAAMGLIGAASAEQVLGKPLLDVFHPESHTRIQARLEWSLDRGRVSPVPPLTTLPLLEEMLLRLDGSALDAEVTCAPLDAAADIPLIVLTLRNVTERKRAIAALRESEERLTLAFAGAQEGVWDWNLETGAVVYSPRWKEMLGYADHEIEPHVSAWERLLHPDDRSRADQVIDNVRRGARTYEGEFRLRHKQGHYVHVLSRGFPVRRELGGPAVRIVGTHFDLSERRKAETALRESEERLTLAFAGAQEGVWDWNLETGAVVYSPRWKEMLGYAEDEVEPHVSAWERILHPDDRARAEEVNESVRRGAKTYEGEFRLRHKAGHYVFVLSRGFPVRREPDGPVVRIVGTHFDLTERKRADAERARTEYLARLVFAQEDERRRIAREMHDQFGEHLTSLNRWIGMLKQACADNVDSTDLRGQVADLEAVAQRLDRDVDHLVWELRPTALDDLGLRAALANYVQDWSKRVNVAANVHASGQVEDRLTSEVETTLYRIAQEALTNVAKHARATRVDVLLDRRADHVLLVVEDDGLGFEPGEADQAGGGFGLLGMRERAALVGATLEIESVPGKGTTILVRTPIQVPASPASDNG
jgi:PAS domain S-box-containing protein